MPNVAPDDLPLERAYRWEREAARRIFLTQPHGGGQIRQWTWAEAIGESRRIAAYLKAQNWEPESRIAILSKNCAWWLLADLAIWMAGHVSVPVYPSLKPSSARQILEHSEARICFLGATDEPEMAAQALPAGVCPIALPTAAHVTGQRWEELLANTPPLTGSPTRPASALATLIYTSGTTGAPKSVMHSFANLSYNVKTIAAFVNLTAEERILSYLPLAHIVERVAVETLFIWLGARIFFTEGLDTFIADLQRAEPTLFLSVPRLLSKFQQNVFAKIPARTLEILFRVPLLNRVVKRRILHALGLGTVRFAACGAAPLPPPLLSWYRSLGLNLVEGYGLTETLITHLPSPESVRPGYVGAAFSGVQTRLGEQSELQMKSPMTMLGYFKDVEATQDSLLPDGFFRTGDICEIAPDGQLKITGRIKEQFKTSKGKYVAPAPIENQLARDPDVEACCVMGAGYPSPFALVLITPEARKRCDDPKTRAAFETALAALFEQTNEQLDPHERLAFIAIVDGPWTVSNGMLTPTLKLKRPLLEQHYRDLMEGWISLHQAVIWESLPVRARAAN
ncbi:MAG: AMP-binding protein [Acidobacteriia bacterium]|nr:AMP-binding protein [Terriglobia bacterium]